jgi:ATP-binding cassette, subfamily B, bacterial PglK
MTTIKKLAVLFLPSDFRKIVILLMGMLVVGLTDVVGVASIAPFMAVVSSPDIIHQNKYLNSTYLLLGFSSDNSFLAGMGIFVLVVLIISNSFNALLNWRMINFCQMQTHGLALRLLNKYLSQPYLFFLSRNTSEMRKNVLTEAGRGIMGVVMPCMQILAKFVGVILIITFLIVLDPFLAVSSVAVLGGAYGLTYRVARERLHKAGTSSTKMQGARFKIADEALSGIKDLKLSGRENEFLKRFSGPSKEQAQSITKGLVISTLPRYLLETVAFGGIVIIVIYLVSGNGGGEVIPVISLYALAGYRLMPALQQIYTAAAKIRFNLSALDVLVEEVSLPDGGKAFGQQKLKPLPFEKLFQLQSVGYSYPNMADSVVSEIELNIESNTTIGLVGATGSGKTTLVDIMLGLLSPKHGRLIVDGVEITSGNISAWQRNLGYVPQSIYLADDTILNNIAFAISDDEIDPEKVKEAAKLAELDGFIQTLPKQYQTHVGERGVRLSGGQRQRIGIARALYHNPKVLVLDEATSALDGITEDVVMDAIHNLSHRKTIIIIAHRLATVKECDVVYVLEKGRVVDSGTYDDLMKHNLKFQKMANI